MIKLYKEKGGYLYKCEIKQCEKIVKVSTYRYDEKHNNWEKFNEERINNEVGLTTTDNKYAMFNKEGYVEKHIMMSRIADDERYGICDWEKKVKEILENER